MEIFGNTSRVVEYGTAHSDETNVEGVVITGYDPATDKWLALEWTKQKTIWLAGGGKEESETYAQAAMRELREETGYTNFARQIQLSGPVISHYFNDKKGMYRRSHSFAFLFILDSTIAGEQALEPHEQFVVTWLNYDTLRKAIIRTGGGVEHWLAILTQAYTYVAQANLVTKDNRSTQKRK